MTATIGEDLAVAKYHLLNEFIRGLKPSVRIMVKKEYPADFHSALEYAIRFEGLQDEEAGLDRSGYLNTIHTVYPYKQRSDFFKSCNGCGSK